MAVWFDSFVPNVDRTPRNPNLLRWHRELYFIDHGAALYFHHNWPTSERMIESPFGAIRDHLLLPWASALGMPTSRPARSGCRGFSAAFWAKCRMAGCWPGPTRQTRMPGAPRMSTSSPGDWPPHRIFVEEAIRARAQLV